MNVVTLIGNLATDVERVSDTSVRFTIAVDRPGPAGTDGVDQIEVYAYDRQAETCSQYLASGTRVALDGRLRSEDGIVYVRANRIQFLSGPRES